MKIKFNNFKFTMLFLFLNILSVYAINYFLKYMESDLRIPSFFIGRFWFLISFFMFLIFNFVGMFLIYNKCMGGMVCYFILILIQTLCGYLFFVERVYGISFIIMFLMILNFIYIGIRFYKISKSSSAIVLICLTWIIYASILIFFIWVYNEM